MAGSKRKSGAEAGADVAEAEQQQEENPTKASTGNERKDEGVAVEKAAEKEKKAEEKGEAKNGDTHHYKEDPDYGAVSDDEEDQPVPGKGTGEKSEGVDVDELLEHEPPPQKKPRIAPGLSVADVAERNSKREDHKPRDKKRLEILMQLKTAEDMKRLVAEHSRPEAEYKVGDTIKVDDLMQTGYEYKLSEPIGQNFKEGFEPKFGPKEMLALGVFEGKQVNDMLFELPREWFEHALEKGKLSPEGPNEALNYFGLKSRLPLPEWQKKNWVPKDDVRGWFQWYCRYYLGRRTDYDDHEISRWRQLRRHAGQIKAHCKPGDLECRRKQRQALLNWSHDPFI